MSEETATEQVEVVGWFDEALSAYRANEAHFFPLYGDVSGYAQPGMSVLRYLIGQMVKSGRIVLLYDRAGGITFADEDGATVAPIMRKMAIKLLAATGEDTKPATQRDSMEAALAKALKGQGGLGGAKQGDADEDDPFEDVTLPSKALPIIEQLLRNKRARRKIAVIINHADKILPDAPVSQLDPDDRTTLVRLLNWAGDPQMANQGNYIFLLTAQLTALHAELRATASGARAIEVPLPDQAARLEYIAWYLAQREQRKKPIALVDGYTVREMANATAGLSLRHVEDILLKGAQAGGVSRSLVKGHKDRIIAQEYSEIAEMLEPLPGGFTDLGGMEHIITWAREEIIEPLREGRAEDAAKGFTLAGPPGTGKTIFAQALGKETGFNSVKLLASKIEDKFVGESEKRMARFLAFCRALAPVVIFVDEIDQSNMGSRGNESGNPVASNLFNQLLQFLSDESLRGKVVVVFATNRPDLLDPALLRFGRMDAVIPVLLPDQAARISIANVQARIQGVTFARGVVETLAARTEKYSAADIAAVVTKARKLAKRAGSATVQQDAVDEALVCIRPNSLTKADYFTRLALLACNDLSLLPPALREYRVEQEKRAAAEDEIPFGEALPAFREERDDD